jgi:hypothetical protein
MLYIEQWFMQKSIHIGHDRHYGHCPSYQAKKHDVSENGSVSVFRGRGGTYYDGTFKKELLCFIGPGLVVSKEPTRVDSFYFLLLFS